MAPFPPASYLEMPRWWDADPADRAWLEDLPALVDALLVQWTLTAGPSGPWHGSNALALAVSRDGRDLVLRLAPPTDDVATEVAALRHWAGRGVVELVDADIARGVTLLQRLDPDRHAGQLPVGECLEVLAATMTRLAVPPPTTARSTGDLVARRLAVMEDEWRSFATPFDRSVLDAALNDGSALATPREEVSVNGDLHPTQVLAGPHGSWVCVDPLLLRGDREYDLARILWSRLDEVDTDHGIRTLLDHAVEVAGLDTARARAWVRFRAVDYWLWGLQHGLTDDPRRCRRLLAALD